MPSCFFCVEIDRKGEWTSDGCTCTSQYMPEREKQGRRLERRSCFSLFLFVDDDDLYQPVLVVFELFEIRDRLVKADLL